MGMSHGVVHFEIPADDPEALVSFYRSLFGWQIDKFPGEMEYWMVRTVPTDDKGMPTEPGGINGGMMRRMAPDQRPLNYVNVESVADYVAKAKSLGATILMDKTPIPGMGWFAQLVDPQGNFFAMFQDDTSAQ
jgi:predicted enzyme related to lactoylglutathione lyase